MVIYRSQGKQIQGHTKCKCHSTDRSVFAQLAERGESILMCLANPVDHLFCDGTEHVALCTLLLLFILFLLIPVVPHSYRETRRRTKGLVCVGQISVYIFRVSHLDCNLYQTIKLLLLRNHKNLGKFLLYMLCSLQFLAKHHLIKSNYTLQFC